MDRLIKELNDDGANYQAKAVLCYLEGASPIEESYNSSIGRYGDYEAKVIVHRWENCREQGYLLQMVAENLKQINIAFFEHRNSDSIHAVVWYQDSKLEIITIDDAEFGDSVYTDKHDTSFSVNVGEASKMADYIAEVLKAHWISGSDKEEQEIIREYENLTEEFPIED